MTEFEYWKKTYILYGDNIKLYDWQKLEDAWEVGFEYPCQTYYYYVKLISWIIYFTPEFYEELENETRATNN